MRPAAWIDSILLCVVASTAGACVGTIGERAIDQSGSPGTAGASGMTGGPVTGGVAACSGEGTVAVPSPGASPVRRLNRREYDNTIRDLLGERSGVASSFTPEEKALGFDNNADALGVSSLLAEQYEAAAGALASRAAETMPALLGCDVGTRGEDPCARDFLRSFGLRAYRRPLTPEENDRLFAFYAASKQADGFKAGVRMVVQAMLQSPHFLYRVETGAPVAASAAVRKLGPYEVASRLSYLLWNSMPDRALFEAAAANDLGTPAAVARQARRMLDDGKARDALLHFGFQWLDVELVRDIDKDPKLFPAFRPALRGLFEKESESFLDHVLRSAGGKLGILLRADYTFANRELATLYGVAAPPGEAFVRVQDDPARRSGILTQAAFLASHADAQQGSPVARGLFVRERLLCAPPPPAPDGVEIKVPVFDKTVTTRQRFAQHRADPTCASCHRLFDPVGMSFEHFDALGQWRDSEAGRPVDASGELFATDDIDGAYVGVTELAERLAGSAQVRGCVVKQGFRFGYGRAEGDGDRCTLQQLETAFAGGDLGALFLALTQTDAFFYRSAGETP
jgi:hypothetical protein